MTLWGCIISFLYIKPQLVGENDLNGWVVLYRFSTSNHNYACSCPCGIALYYIVSLHQTTTANSLFCSRFLLYYIVSLHQTTTARVARTPSICCIISFLYIKPQPQSIAIALLISCIISFLYIKPQHHSHAPRALCVVLYRFSTSNHNTGGVTYNDIALYYIVSLHQTTTDFHKQRMSGQLYYIVSLHQTTTSPGHWQNLASCIISFLYIKPQL